MIAEIDCDVAMRGEVCKEIDERRKWSAYPDEESSGNVKLDRLVLSFILTENLEVIDRSKRFFFDSRQCETERWIILRVERCEEVGGE